MGRTSSPTLGLPLPRFIAPPLSHFPPSPKAPTLAEDQSAQGSLACCHAWHAWANAAACTSPAPPVGERTCLVACLLQRWADASHMHQLKGSFGWRPEISILRVLSTNAFKTPFGIKWMELKMQDKYLGSTVSPQHIKFCSQILLGLKF